MLKCNIRHITSSPRYPQGNAEAERAVQTIKRMLEKADDPYIALMNYRATPLQNGYSPSELLFGRKIQTNLPQIPSKLVPKSVNIRKLQTNENQMRSKVQNNYNRKKRARPKQQLVKGENVFVKDFKTDGKVLTEACRPRSYIIDTPRGILHRNRRHLIKIQNSNFDNTEEECTGFNSKTDLCDKQNDTASHATPLPHISQDVSQSDNDNNSHYVTRSGRISKPPDRLDL